MEETGFKNINIILDFALKNEFSSFYRDKHTKQKIVR